MSQSTLSKKISSTAGMLLVAGIVVAINVIAGRFFNARIDLTEEKLYSLSSGTREILDGLKRDVSLKFFWSQKNDEVPPMVKQYGQRVYDLLKEYESAGGGRVHLEIFDPEPDTDEEDLARKYGLSAQGLDMFGVSDSRFYCGLVAVSGKNEKNMPFLSEQEDNQLEYKLTRLLTEVSNTTKPKIGLISSLPVAGSPGNPFMRQRGAQKWFFVQQLESAMEVQDLGTTVESIPADIKTIVLIHPKGLSEKVQYAIDQFVLRGGRLLAFLDPVCLADQAGGPMPGMGGGGPSEFGRLLSAWGVQFDTENVAADTALGLPLNLGDRVGKLAHIMNIPKAQFDQGDIATANLEMIWMPAAGSFKVSSNVTGLVKTDLIKTTDGAGTLNSFMAQSPGITPEAINKDLKPSGALPLMIKLAGKFPSAFPGGAPKAEGDKPESVPASPSQPHLNEASAESVVVLVGDADMLDNRWCVNVQNMFGAMMVEALNDNLNLVLNTVEFLSGNNALISLRSRGTYARPLKRLQEMEQTAMKSRQAEIDKFETQLQETQRKIQELQAGKSKDQKMILSPEQKAEIAKFREQEVAVSKNVREIKKDLKKEMQSTMNRMRAANIFGVPLVVGLAGLGLGLIRRRRAESK
jgi:ABC-type uncharacterized transport system involved in gliding motility auxiliary subunit